MALPDLPVSVVKAASLTPLVPSIVGLSAEIAMRHRPAPRVIGPEEGCWPAPTSWNLTLSAAAHAATCPAERACATFSWLLTNSSSPSLPARKSAPGRSKWRACFLTARWSTCLPRPRKSRTTTALSPLRFRRLPDRLTRSGARVPRLRSRDASIWGHLFHSCLLVVAGRIRWRPLRLELPLGIYLPPSHPLRCCAAGRRCACRRGCSFTLTARLRVWQN